MHDRAIPQPAEPPQPYAQPQPPYAQPQPPDAHLNDYLAVVLRRRRLIAAIAAAVLAAAALKTFLTRPEYQASAQILIEKNDPTVLNFKGVTEEKVGTGIDDYYQTQYKVLQSRSLARRVIERLDLLADPEFGGPRTKEQIQAALAAPPGESPDVEQAVDRFLKRLTVSPVRNTRLVAVSTVAYRPELAARVANTLASTYIEQSLDFRYQTSSEAGKWLGTQMDEQRRRVEELDRKLISLKEQQGIVNIEERRTLLDQRLKELGTALNERKTERLQKEALYRQMAAASNPEELPEVMGSPLVQSLGIELATLERTRAQLLERYLDQHPEVVRVRNQIAETKAKMRTEAARVIRSAENAYKAASAQEASVSAALESAKLEALELSKSGVNYDSEKRELDAAQQVLNGLMSREKETNVAAELKTSNIRVLDAATVPKDPVRPRKLRDLSLGAILGLFLGTGFAFFLEYLDSTIRTPEDVRVHLGAPLLGLVAELPGDEAAARVVLHRRADPGFAEGYRMVRTALGYSWPEAGPRVVLVTSTAPGEGKTLTAVNLALTLAAGDQRVILLDGDLRKPQTHVLVRSKRSPGLSDVIVGRAKASQAIQTRLDCANLAYLPAGTAVPSPADILTSRTVRGFLEGLRGFYDWVIVDAPPVAAVTEPLMLAPLTDGVILVVGSEMIPRKAVQHTLERLDATGARVLGVVLNRAQIEKHSYYYQHYYGHAYGSYGRYGEAPAAARRRA